METFPCRGLLFINNDVPDNLIFEEVFLVDGKSVIVFLLEKFKGSGRGIIRLPPDDNRYLAGSIDIFTGKSEQGTWQGIVPVFPDIGFCLFKRKLGHVFQQKGKFLPDIFFLIDFKLFSIGQGVAYRLLGSDQPAE